MNSCIITAIKEEGAKYVKAISASFRNVLKYLEDILDSCFVPIPFDSYPLLQSNFQTMNTNFLQDDDILIELPKRPLQKRIIPMSKAEMKMLVELHAVHNLPFHLGIPPVSVQGKCASSSLPVTVRFTQENSLVVQWAEELARLRASGTIEDVM